MEAAPTPLKQPTAEEIFVLIMRNLERKINKKSFRLTFASKVQSQYQQLDLVIAAH